MVGRALRKICLVCDKEFDGALSQCPDDKTALVPLKADYGIYLKNLRISDLEREGYTKLACRRSSGRSAVFYGVETSTGDQVIIKVLPAESSRFNAFARQVAILRAICHPKIIRLRAFGQLQDGTPYYVTDFFPGDPISVRFETFSKDEFCTLFSEIADAMHIVHEEGAVHWDLKPADILVDDKYDFRILDFGKGQPWIHGDNYLEQKTERGDFFGAPEYIAPETCKDSVVTAQSNIYSLGCIMYACLDGRPPFVGNNWMHTVMLKLGNKIPPFRSPTARGFPSTITSLVLKCLSLDPEDRPQTMAYLRDQLSRIGHKD